MLLPKQFTSPSSSSAAYIFVAIIDFDLIYPYSIANVLFCIVKPLVLAKTSPISGQANGFVSLSVCRNRRFVCVQIQVVYLFIVLDALQENQ